MRPAARGVWTFVIPTILLSALFDTPIFGPRPLSEQPGLFVWLAMWSPGLVALALVLLGQVRFRDLGLAAHGGIHLVWGLVLPLVITGPVFVLASAAGFCGLSPMALKEDLLGAAIALPLGLARALGEEIGWRGYLFPRLRSRFSFPQASIFSGLIWALWHFPLIAQGGYLETPQLPLGLILVLATLWLVGQSFVYGWLRERSGSVWPPACFHAMSIWFTYRVMGTVIVPQPKTALVVGETSIGFAVLGLCLAVLFWSGPPGNPQRTPA